VEESGRGLTETISRHFVRGTEEKYEELDLR
jgi:hypothetical protein